MQAQPSVTSTFRPREPKTPPPSSDEALSPDEVMTRIYWGLGAMACYAVGSVLGRAYERTIKLGRSLLDRSLFSGGRNETP